MYSTSIQIRIYIYILYTCKNHEPPLVKILFPSKRQLFCDIKQNSSTRICAQVGFIFLFGQNAHGSFMIYQCAIKHTNGYKWFVCYFSYSNIYFLDLLDLLGQRMLSIFEPCLKWKWWWWWRWWWRWWWWRWWSWSLLWPSPGGKSELPSMPIHIERTKLMGVGEC